MMGHWAAAALLEGDSSSFEAQPEYNLDGSVAETPALCQGLCKIWSVVRSRISRLGKAA